MVALIHLIFSEVVYMTVWSYCRRGRTRFIVSFYCAEKEVYFIFGYAREGNPRPEKFASDSCYNGGPNEGVDVECPKINEIHVFFRSK